MIEVLVVGDEFIPAGSYEEAFAAAPDSAALVRLRNVRLAGDNARQHARQVMERAGANAVPAPAPAELVDALDGAEALCLHFAGYQRTVRALGELS
jgi:hypothetical protein